MTQERLASPRSDVPTLQTADGTVNRREFVQMVGLAVGGSSLTGLLPSGAAAQSSAPAAGPQPRKGGVLKVANPAEPSSLDPVFTTQTLTADMSTNYFEGLLAFSSRYAPKPMLAESYETSKDAKTYTFALRKGIPFHNGKEMTSADVAASLKRWFEIGTRGRTIAGRVDQVRSRDRHTVVVQFKEPTALFPFYLCLQEAGVAPEEVASAAGKNQMKQVIGTGPYRIAEHLPDRYIRLARHDGYVPRAEAPDGRSGRKMAYLDEIRYIPASETATRADGLVTGEYQFAEMISPDSYANLSKNPQLTLFIVKPLQWYAVHMNKKQGLFRDVRMRRAIQKAIDPVPGAKAAFGSEMFYRLDPGIAGPETIWHTDVSKELYNRPNPEEAKALLKEAGYKGEPVVWLTNKDSAFNYTLALTFKGQLEAIGMSVDLQAVDQGTMNSRRAKPDLWNAFITGHNSFEHPLLLPFLSASWPGWWESADKDRLLAAIAAEPNEKKGLGLIQELQSLIYKEAAIVKVCDFFTVRGGRKEVRGYANMAAMFFFNVWLA